MAGLLGKLNIKIGADTAEFNRAMDKGASKAQATMQGITRSVKRAAPVIGAALTAAAAAFSIQLKKTIDDADELSKLSRKIGIGIESLSAFRHAAVLAGTDFETMTKGIGRFARSISDAGNELSTQVRAFKDIGVEYQNAEGSLRDVETVLLDVADRFSQMEDGTRKTARAMELFGRSGMELIPFLNEGREGIDKIRKEAEELGIVFDLKASMAAEEFNDNITRLQASASGLFITFANEVLPTLVDLSAQALDNQDKVDGLKQSSDKLVGTLLTTVGATKLIAAGFQELGNQIGDTMAAIRILSGNGTWTGAFSGPLINAVRFRKELAAVLEKSNDDFGDSYQKAVEEIEELWTKHWERQNKIAEEGAEKTLAGVKGVNDKMEKEAEALIKSLRTPLEVFADEQERLGDLLKANLIDQETYNRALDKAKESYEKNTQAMQKANSVMKDLGATFSSAFEDAIVEGQKFSDVLKGLEQDIIRIIVRRKVIEPLFGAIFGGQNGGGFLSTLFNAKGNVFSGGNAITAFSNGGVLGGPTMFPMAGGRLGVAGEAGVEGIFPLQRTPDGKLGVRGSGGGGNVEVNVYAPEGTTARQERQQDGGIERINIYLDEVVAKNISQQGSKSYRALSKTFGLNQKTINR